MKRSNWTLFAVPLILIIVVVLGSRLGREIQHARYLAQERHFKERLSSFDFVNIGDNTNLQSEIQQNVSERITNGLSEDQKEKLGTRIFNMLLTYHEGTFNAYAKFKYPPDLRNENFFDKEYIEAYRAGLRDFKLPPSVENGILGSNGWNAVSSAKAEEVLRLYYEFTIAGDPLQTNVFVCHKCWTQASLNQMQVVVTKSQDRVSPVTAELGGTNTFGALIKEPNMDIVPRPEDILKQKKTLESAYVSIVVKTDGPDAMFPILVHFYWVDDFKDWIPYQFSKGLQTVKTEHIF